MRSVSFATVAGLILGLCSTAGAEAIVGAPAGTYHLDPQHARLVFQVNHLGISNYTAFFKEFSADLIFDPEAPETMTVTASVNPVSIETDFPDPTYDFNADLAGPNLLDAAAFPMITYSSRSVKLTGANTADVTGDLTLHGVTAPLTLTVIFNGGYAGFANDPGGARIGFSAKGSLLRSVYGMGYGIPAAGSKMGVGDEVTFFIEAEFLNPDAPKPAE